MRRAAWRKRRTAPRRRPSCAIAREAGIAILYGYPERGAGGHIYNTAQLIDRTGRIAASYRKTHLFGEIDRAAFSAGAALPEIVELDGLRIGILICYDVEFPENVRTLALKGADLVAVPTALMQPFDIVARTIVPARAYENQVFLAYADRCGTEGELSYCGLSCVIAPDGSDLARAGRSEALIIADLDAERLAQSRTHQHASQGPAAGSLRRARPSTRSVTMDKTYHQPLGGNKMPRFGGPATMMRLPAVSSAKGLDAAFVGVPFDIGTSNRSGARFGPRQIRAESCLIRPYNMATRAAPFDSLSVADIGDVAINTFNLEKSIAIIEAAYDEILSPQLHPDDHRRRSHHRPADPARAEEEVWTGRHGAHRRPRRRQRFHVRRTDRPRHAVPPRGRGRACWTASAWRRSASGPPAIPPRISTGPGRRASASCRPRSAGTSPSPR